MSPGKDRSDPPPQTSLKPYETPELVEYGSITKLTQGSFTLVNDAGGGMRFMLPCL